MDHQESYQGHYAHHNNASCSVHPSRCRAATRTAACCLQVQDNTINSYGPGIWLGQDPMSWGAGASGFTNNYNVRFVNNTIANAASTPFLLTSAANVTVANTTFLNVLCRDDDDMPAFDWQVTKACMTAIKSPGLSKMMRLTLSS